MNLQEKDIRKMKNECKKRIGAEKARMDIVCQRYSEGQIDFPVLFNAVNLAEKEIRKQARTRDVLGIVLGDE